MFICWLDQDHGHVEEGVEWKEKKIFYLIQLIRLSSLVGIGKGEAMIHTSWYPNYFPAEG